MEKRNKIKGKGCCDDIIFDINLTKPLEVLLNAFFAPINILIKLFVKVFKFAIEHWNRQIYTLSFIFERFFNLFIFSVNGYLNVLSLILVEIKILLKFSFLSLKYNTFVLASALLVPILNELYLYLFDTITLDIFTDLFQLKTKKLVRVFHGSYNLFTGRTVKPKCNIDDYSSYEEMKNNCHEQYIPRCSINLSTLWMTAFYIVIFIYIASWYAFLKIFYDDSSNINIIDYLFTKLNILDETQLSDIKTTYKNQIID